MTDDTWFCRPEQKAQRDHAEEYAAQALLARRQNLNRITFKHAAGEEEDASGEALPPLNLVHPQIAMHDGMVYAIGAKVILNPKDPYA